MFTIRHDHHHYYHSPDLSEVKGWINSLHDLIMNRTETIMAKIDDLNAALDDLTNTVNEAVVEIEAQLKIITTPGISDAQADAAIARIQGVTTSLKTEVANLKADNPPA